MKKILFAVLAFGALVACTNEEVIEIDREAIEFGDAFVDNGTRAAVGAAVDNSYGATKLIKEFQVWGNIESVDTTPATYTDVFAGDEVTGDTYGDVWACKNTQYWIYGATYNFAAVVDAAEGAVTLGTDKLPATIAYTADGATDLLYANLVDVTRDKDDDDKLVKFTFDHLLSKVKFTIENNTPNDNYGFKVTSLSFNTPASAVASVPAKTWGSFTDGTRVFTFAEEIKKTAKIESDKELLVIPYEYAAQTLIVNVTIDWYVNDVKVKTGETFSVKNASVVTLERGKAYNFNIAYGVNDKIEFTVEALNGWDNNSGAGNNVNLQ